VILEGVVTTLSTEGALNIAPMGPIVSSDLDMSKFTLRPFKSSTTYRNLKARGEGVFHVTDNVLLLAQAAIGAPLEPEPATRPAAMVAGAILADACRYFEFRAVAIDDRDERATIRVETVAEGRIRDFLGFNRARNAVLEAAILATRVGLIPPTEILGEYDGLSVLVDKTGGPAERAAFDLLADYVSRAAEKPPFAPKVPSP